MKALVLSLLFFSSSITGYTIPEEEPQIYLTQLEDKYAAIYLNGVILIDYSVDINSVEGEVVLVHELTHFLQDYNSNLSLKCFAEREAYLVGDALYLHRLRIPPRITLGRLLEETCNAFPHRTE